MDGSVKEERQKIYDDLVVLGRNILSNAILQLVEDGYYDPCVGVIYDDERVEFLYPRYKNENQRNEAFDKVNKYVEETGAVGAVLVMETWFTPKGETKQKEALLLIRQSLGMNELEAYPFERTESGTPVVSEKIGPSKPEKNYLLHAFSEAMN